MSSAGAADPALIMLAQNAGILTRWEDVTGRTQHISEPVLRNLLDALGLPCMSPSQISDSMHQLEQEREVSDGDMVVVRAGEVPHLRSGVTGRWQLTLESGQVLSGALQQVKPGWVSIRAVTELGYHMLALGPMTVTLAVVPLRCPDLDLTTAGEPRPWGIVAQIYSLYDGHDGIDTRQTSMRSVVPAWAQGSNFGAVTRLVTHAARVGASAVALSPAHAMFSADPHRYSPYSPSSRLFLNACYGDPVQILGADVMQHVLGDWSRADVFSAPARSQLLDWPRIVSLRLRLLRDMFSYFNQHGPAHLSEKFRVFRHEAGRPLQHHAVYEALHAHHVPALGPRHGWRDWPLPLQDPTSQATAQFARQHEPDVSFHAFAQWIACESAQQAQISARSAGMSCGLIGDLAIGTDPRGSHAWSLQNDILSSVSVGAPPDVFQPQGQNWGLTAFSPRGLRRGAYAAFIATLRANLRYSGGIRIDHVAGMGRLWLISNGATAAEGAYLTYPRRELLGLIALEATRHKAIVIGENLGTVSEELNEALTEHGILGTDVLWFEREAPRPPVSVAPFRSALQWSRDAVSTPSTHDLPTIHGWWQERDIQWKMLLGQLTRANQHEAQNERARERADLWRALGQEGCVQDAVVMPPDETPLNAILSFVARTPAPLALFSLEDLLGVLDQPNMPGMTAGPGLVCHPNWVQYLPASVETMFSDSAVLDRIEAVRQARSLP